MRSITLLGLAIVAIAILLGVHTTPTVQADMLLQEQPRLDGMNVYFAEAEGEASRFDRTDAGLSRFAGLLRELGANLYTLEWHTGFPTDANLIVIVGPNKDLAPDQVARLWSYLNNGGHLLFLAEPTPPNAGLFALTWADMGVGAHNDVVVTEDTVTDPEHPRLISTFMTNRLNPNHPITTGLQDSLAFFTARSLMVDSSIQSSAATPLVYSDDTFYGESAYKDYLQSGTFQFNIGSDTARGPLPLAAAFENPRTQTRMVVIGDREFATNGFGLLTSPPYSGGFLYPGNVRFLLNSVTWLLSKDAVDMTFPTPGPTATPTITPSPTPSPTPTLEATATPAQ